MMSPLSGVGVPPLAACFKRPDSTDHPLAGKPAFLNPRHPFVVVPSKRSFHPASRSAAVRRACSTDDTLMIAVGSFGRPGGCANNEAVASIANAPARDRKSVV